jgi:tRNA A37 N6-isopentenylltransferase MiaA
VLAVCCINEMEAYQLPEQKEVLLQISKKGRHFSPSWYNKYPWITLCLKDMKVFCLYCRYAKKQKKFFQSNLSDVAFTDRGFDNLKKALEKFSIHDASACHMEATMI